MKRLMVLGWLTALSFGFALFAIAFAMKNDGAVIGTVTPNEIYGLLFTPLVFLALCVPWRKFPRYKATAFALIVSLFMLPATETKAATPFEVTVALGVGAIGGYTVYRVIVHSLTPSVKCVTMYEEDGCQGVVVSNACLRILRNNIKKNGWCAPFINFTNTAHCQSICSSNKVIIASGNGGTTVRLVVESSKDMSEWTYEGYLTLGDYELEWSGETQEPASFYRVLPVEVSTMTAKQLGASRKLPSVEVPAGVPFTNIYSTTLIVR